MLKRWIAGHPRVVLKTLPRYSPDINPQEQWWNYERSKLLNNRYFPTNRRLGGAVRHFARNAPPATVKSVCNSTAIYALLKYPHHFRGMLKLPSVHTIFTLCMSMG